MKQTFIKRSHLRQQSAVRVFSRFAVSLATVAAMMVTLLPPLHVAAAGETIAGGSNTVGDVDDYIAIGGISVTGPGSNVVPVTMSVDEGELSMTTTTGLTFTGASNGSTLQFEGTVDDVNAALATLRYRNIDIGTVTFTAQLTSPGEVFFPGNGHVYEVITTGGIDATNAFAAAEALTKYGSDGYLATITTQEENDFVGPRLSGDGWFGASDSGAEGDWQWTVGPEAGTPFWLGLGSGDGGVPVASRYSNWATGEPNDFPPGEDCAQFYSSGTGWNDLPCTGATLPYYIVEYGAPGDLPAVSYTSFSITTTVDVGTVTVDSCLDILDLSTNQADHRFDTINLTTDIDCTGETLDPLFNQIDSFFGPLPFRGSFVGNGNTISGFAVDGGISGYVGLFSAMHDASVSSLTLEGTTVSGSNCVGAVAGYASDTLITGVTSAIDIESTGDGSGGLVGCLEALEGEATITNSTSSGTIDASNYQAGGLVGWAYAEDQPLTITSSAFTGDIVDNGYGQNGGIVGSMEGEETATITIANNSSVGFDLSGHSQVGGMIGGVDLEDGAVLDISGSNLTGGITGYYEVGGFIGEASIDDGSQLNITGSMNQPIAALDYYVGGLIGDLYLEGDEASNTRATISDTTVTGTVTGIASVGGVIGSVDRDYGEERIILDNVHVTNDISGTEGEVGGLVGYGSGVEVERSSMAGGVDGDDNVGGLVGGGDEAIVTESFSTGDVSGMGDRIGGIIGQNQQGTIARSYTTGDVTGDDRVGGITGANGGLISDSYARGDVIGDLEVGGVSGRCGGDIEFSYATGEVGGDVDFGGLLGYDDGCDVNSSFWDTETSLTMDSAAGTGKTTAEMKTKLTFVDTESSDGLTEAWNFASIWGMTVAVNNGYPCLTWQNEDCTAFDEDEDGISSEMESAAPNGGDANNDGTPDAEQSNVGSLVNELTSNYTTVALPSACDLQSASIAAEGVQAAQDAGFSYASGFVNFSADCGTPGFDMLATIYQYGVSTSGLIVRKYNPNTLAYFTVTSAVLSQQTIGGQSVAKASYHVIDGEALDTDGTADGIIVDPVGLAASAVGAPSTGLGGRR